MRLLHAPIVVASLMVALPAFPQALTEHAAAVAGASVGTAGGKAISSGVTKIFGSVDDTAAAAAKPKKEEKSKPVTKVVEPPPAAQFGAQFAPSPAPGGSDSSESSRSELRHSKASAQPRAAVPSPAAAVAPAPDPPVKEPAMEDLLSVKTGTREDAFTAALGAPSSRVTIPEDGHLMEILSYSARGQLLGTVRLDNGEVISVQTSGQAR